jgi:alanine dehydrogenase
VLDDLFGNRMTTLFSNQQTIRDEPTYVVHGVVHYCVTNMPGAVARTSTYALTNATIPYVRALASRGVAGAVRADRSLAMGINAHRGTITYEAVARDLGMTYRPLSEVL